MTDQTAAVEVWARMLCAADVHVNDGDHPTWQQLSAMPGRGQDEYRKAARWLLPRLTVGQPGPPSVPADADLRDRIAQVVRTVPIRLGPNALAMAQRGESIILNLNEADAFAEALAPVLPAPADRAAIYREVAEELAGIDFHPNAKSQNLELCRLLAGRFRRKADEVESMADEARQAECACDPAPHRQPDGTYSHWAGCPVAEAEQLLDERVAAAKEQQAGEGR